MKNHALLAGFCAILLPSLPINAAAVFPIADQSGVLQVCGGLAHNGTNYLAALVVGQLGASSEVSAQLISPTGTPSSSLINVGSGSVFPPVLTAAFGGGTFLEVWSDGNLTSGVDMFGQRISTAGATVGPSFPLLTSAGSHGFQTICALGFGGGNFLVVWQDGTSGYFYGQIVTAGGSLSGSEFLISDQPNNSSFVLNPAAVAFDGTNFLVVWQSENGPTDTNSDSNGTWVADNNTFGASVSPSGSAQSPFQISQTASLDTQELGIAFDGTNYLVVWATDTLHDSHALGNGVDWTLYGRFVSPGGGLSASQVVLEGSPGSQSYNNRSFPNLAFDGQNYLLVWTPSFAAGLTNADSLNGQFFDRSASAVGVTFAALPALGTNRPILADGLIYDGTRFVLAGAYGLLTPNAQGDFNGIAYWQTGGVFIPSSTTPPTLATSGRLVGSQFSLQFTGTPGINYVVQAATNLAMPNWTALVTNSPTNGTFSFTDTSATNNNRFYRAVKQ